MNCRARPVPDRFLTRDPEPFNNAEAGEHRFAGRPALESMDPFTPAYLKDVDTTLLRERAARLKAMLSDCVLCPRRCHVDRAAGKLGVCRTGARAWVSSFGPHYGEESPLVGKNGSGTIFFTHCNLLCLFCQNYEISHGGDGDAVTDGQLAAVMMSLQERGCHNINLVTPSHVVPQIVAALEIAAGEGLRLPVVYNSSGYDAVDTLRMLDGLVDIYMPDVKFWSETLAKDACDAPDYPAVVRESVREMHRQVGDLVIDPDGIARRGMLVRHLILPNGLADTAAVMRFIAEEISSNTYVNLMPQYRPCGRAAEVKGLGGFPSQGDFDAAVRAARDAGLSRLDRPERIFMVV